MKYIIFLSILIFLSLVFVYLSYNFKKKKIFKFNKQNLYGWMNLTKKERYNLSKKESIAYLDKRKLLLEEIRKEYKNISKNDQKSL